MQSMTIEQVRTERNRRLQASDKYVLPDYPHASAQERTLWLHYRQKLRDMMIDVIFQAQGDPAAEMLVLWPTPPPPGGAAPPS
jgi:hypothetical protein